MSYFAEIDENNIVKRVIVAEQDFINSGAVGDPKNWIQTSYNTVAGVNVKGGTALRKNYAGIGYKYDKEKDAFILPEPVHKTWVLDEETGQYKPPIERPKNETKDYSYNDKTTAWEEHEPKEHPCESCVIK